MTAPLPAEAPTCSAQARLLGEPLPGTGPEATGWFLVEQPGAWGHDALTESELDRLVAEEWERRTAALPVRVQIIRRPGHRRSVQRTVILAHAGPDRTWMRRVALQDTRDLLDIDPALLLSGDEPDLGEPEPGPVLLVCTHAKRDQCCALWGRPVATHLAETHPGQVWESSHVGGHRFAANVIVLPEGYAHGYLTPETAGRVVAAYARGEVDVATMRGRSSLPRPAQAAEVFAREQLGVAGIADLRVASWREVGGDEPQDGPGEVTEVTVEVAGRTCLVRVAARPLGTELLTGCDKPAPKDPGVFALVELTEA